MHNEHNLKAPNQDPLERPPLNARTSTPVNQAAKRRSSDDTVIHTPSRRDSERTSPAAVNPDEDSTELVRSSSVLHHIGRGKGPNIEGLLPAQVGRTIRRKPHRIGDLINKPPISEPTSLVNSEHATHYKSPIDESPFLGKGAASTIRTVNLRKRPVTLTTSWIVEMATSDPLHSIVKPETEVMARGDQGAPKKKITPENMPLPESHAGLPQPDKKFPALTKTTSSHITLSTHPGLNQSSEDHSQNKGESEDLIDISARPTTTSVTKLTSNLIKSLESLVGVDPTNDRTRVLVEEEEIFGKGQEGKVKTVATGNGTEVTESVCIRTTTTIGSVHSPPDHSQDISTTYLDEVPAASSDPPAIRISTPPVMPSGSWTNSGSGEPQASKTRGDFDLLDSPPRLPRSSWPSLTSPSRQRRCSGPATTTAPLDGATTSAHQLTPTKARCGKLCRRASGDLLAARMLDERDGIGMESRGGMIKGEVGTITPTRHLRPSSSAPAVRSPPGQPGSAESRSNEIFAQGAARHAIVKYDPDAAKIAEARRGRAGTAAELEPTKANPPRGYRRKRPLCDNRVEDVDALPGDGSKARRVRFQNVRTPRGSPPEPLQPRRRLVQPLPRATSQDTPQGPKRPFEIVNRFCKAYWGIVRPVFDATSPISMRYARSQSTWRDCGVYTLGLGFILVVILVGVWAIKCFLVVVNILKALVRGFVRLVQL